MPEPNLPKRLRRLLADHGFGALRVEAIPVLNAGYCDNSFSAQMLPNYPRSALQRGLVSDQEAEQWRAGIDRLIEQGEYFFCVNRFLFTAVKDA